ncbi:RIP metalloprotease RseP [Amylibacter sp.]|nr:RIP metalloprotease RseP [Amylibacter sp.]
MIDFLSSIPLIGSPLVSILPFLVIITIVVFVHEYGHYIVGRWCGIHAEIFSVGMGPKLFSRKDKRGTVWQIAAIPLGGYVKFLGDSNASSFPENRKNSSIDNEQSFFNNASLISKTLTVLAGPIANFILSILIFSILIFWNGKQSNEPIIGNINQELTKVYNIQKGDFIKSINGKEINFFSDIYSFIHDDNENELTEYVLERNNHIVKTYGPFPTMPIIGSVMPVSPASSAGLKSGDIIVSYNDELIGSFKQLQKLITNSETTKQKNINVLRKGKLITLQISPQLREFQNSSGEIEKKISIGVSSALAFTPMKENINLYEALFFGFERTYLVISQSISQLSKIIIGEVGIKNLQGPIGIAHVSSDIAKSDISFFIPLIAIISTSIGFLNLLPIPILDGGHLLMFAYEGLTKKKPNQKIMNFLAVIAISLLLTLMILVSINDISRIFLFLNYN